MNEHNYEMVMTGDGDIDAIVVNTEKQRIFGAAATGNNHEATIINVKPPTTIATDRHRCARSSCRRTTGALIILLTLIAIAIASNYSPNFGSTAVLLRIFPPDSPPPIAKGQKDEEMDERELENVLRAASINKTVIVTTLNGAWAMEGTLVEMFLETMRDAQEQLLRHLIMGCMDQHAYNRCLALTSHPQFTISDHGSMVHDDHKNTSGSSSFPYHEKCFENSSQPRYRSMGFHCLRIPTANVDFSGEQLYLTTDYIKMMWRRIKFLGSLLSHGYNFIFTDADILWFRDPFPVLHLQDEGVDMLIASDYYNGIPSDMHNSPNAGFTYVKANKKTIDFYNYWYEERRRDTRMADQEVLNAIKFEEKFKNIGLNLRFLDTQFFGGFCAISRTDMTKVVTMHATCCKGLNAKVNDLRMMLNDWKRWKQFQHEHMEKKTLSNYTNSNTSIVDPHFNMPWACPQSWH